MNDSYRARRPAARCRHWALALFFVAGCLAVLPAQAQTIVNIERLQSPEAKSWHAALDATMDMERGNSVVTDIEAGALVGYRSRRHWIRVMGGVGYLAEDGRPITHNQAAHIRYSFQLTKRARTFHFLQTQSNRFLRLAERSLIGSGVRTALVNEQAVRLDVGTGLFYERERLRSDLLPRGTAARLSAVRMANLIVLRIELRSGVTLLNTAYVQPVVTAPSDYRVLNELSLGVELVPDLALTVDLTAMHDRRPPPGLKHFDLILESGLVVVFD